MNPAFRALQRRNEKLERNNAAMKLTLDRMLADIEMTESVGCAFAWELGASSVKWTTNPWNYPAHEMFSCPSDLAAARRNFEVAIESGIAYQSGRGWLREKVKTDRAFLETAVAAANKDPNMELETPFGRYSLRTLTAT